MKSGILIIIVLLLFPTISNGQSNGRINLTIDGITNTNGTIRIDLFSDQDKFLIEPSFSKDVKIDQQTEILVNFGNIPYGIYAISVYHDLDDNDELDANFIGMPKEPVGFSNDHKPKMGPPNFTGAKFTLDQKELAMTISLYSY